MHNIINIKRRNERIFKLSCNLSNTEVIFATQGSEKVHIINALVYVNIQGEFFTSIMKANSVPKSATFVDLQIELNNYLILHNEISNQN